MGWGVRVSAAATCYVGWGYIRMQKMNELALHDPVKHYTDFAGFRERLRKESSLGKLMALAQGGKQCSSRKDGEAILDPSKHGSDHGENEAKEKDVSWLTMISPEYVASYVLGYGLDVLFSQLAARARGALHFSTEGWGNMREAQEALQTVFDADKMKARDINIEWTGEWEREVDYWARTGKFECSAYSRLPRDVVDALINEEGRHAYIRYIIPESALERPWDPPSEENQKVKDLNFAVHLPCSGDQGFEWRERVFAAPLAEKGHGSIILESVFHGCRRNKNKTIRGAHYDSVADLITLGVATLPETIDLCGWLHKKSGFKPNINVTGISMGGEILLMIIMATNVPFHAVCVLPSCSASPTWTKGALSRACDWDKVLNDTRDQPESVAKKTAHLFPEEQYKILLDNKQKTTTKLEQDQSEVNQSSDVKDDLALPTERTTEKDSTKQEQARPPLPRHVARVRESNNHSTIEKSIETHIDTQTRHFANPKTPSEWQHSDLMEEAKVLLERTNTLHWRRFPFCHCERDDDGNISEFPMPNGEEPSTMLIGTVHDAYIVPESVQDAADCWQEHADMRWMLGGHCSAVMTLDHIVLGAIEETFEKNKGNN